MAITTYNSASYDVLDIPDGYRGIKASFFQRFLIFHGILILAPGNIDDFAISDGNRPIVRTVPVRKEARWIMKKMFQTAEHRIKDVYATNLFVAVVPEIKDRLFDFQLDAARIILSVKITSPNEKRKHLYSFTR